MKKDAVVAALTVRFLLNTTCQDPCVQLAINGHELSIVTEGTKFIIAVVVTLVSRKTARSNLQCHAGKQADIRKNLPATYVDLEPNFYHSYWFIISMATCTMLILLIYAPFA